MPGSAAAATLDRVTALRRLAAAALLAILLVPAALDRTASHAYTVQTVEVSEAGFNPSVCRMNREYVRFKNVGSKPIRVIRPGVVIGDPPLHDTGYIKPGQYSTEFIIPHGGTTEFFDADNAAHGVTVVTPVWVTYWEPICTPDPNYQPPQPPCRQSPHCLRVPGVALD